MGGLRRLGIGLIAAAAMLSAEAPAALATPPIQAHRGGAVVDGIPTFPENTMPAFQAAAAAGFTLEMDVKLTSDNVPVVIHDDTLDRTTICTGRVRDRTAADLLANCPSDVLGSPGSPLPSGTIADPGDHVPLSTLTEVLAFARGAGARVSVEIKNIPTEADFDLSAAYANRVMDAVTTAGLPLSQLVIQSFWPPNLVTAKQRLPGVRTSLLTLAALNAGGPAAAKLAGNEYVSPAWPFDAIGIATAHALGLQVVPYTLDTAAEISAAEDAGVDEVITDDPTMAREALAAAAPPAPAIPAPPTQAECAAAAASRSLPAIDALDPAPGAPRVFAMQPKQATRHVTTHAAYRTKIECMILEHVVPHLADGRPNVVAFNEDIGLATIATGTRGAVARDLFASPGFPSCETQPAPCATLLALEAIHAGYAKEAALYRVRFPLASPIAAPFVAATDTLGRGWMQVFSDMARRYGVYILGSNNQPLFRESTDPAEIAAFADPDTCPTAGATDCPTSVYVATGPEVYNEVFMWGPDDVRQEGPRPLRNVVARNKKVPVTPIEQQLEIAPGPSTGPDAVENLRPYSLPGTSARIGFATSLPAFVYGNPPAGTDPCSDTRLYYMRCLDALGTNLVMQDEANPGRWAGNGGGGYWQPLEWMSSTYRAIDDPSVGFDYNVTPHMVGNLADLAFDGQSAITQRGLGGAGCNYVGNLTLQSDPPEADPSSAAQYVGNRPGFLALAPWAFPDGPRADLRALAAKLSPTSDDPALENDYLETAIVADLPFPPNPNRPGCRTAASLPAPEPPPASSSSTISPGDCANRIGGTRASDRLRGTATGDRIRGRSGNDRIRGLGGRDCLFGGRGADRINARDGEPDLVRCGAGSDRAKVDRRDAVRGCERRLR